MMQLLASGTIVMVTTEKQIHCSRWNWDGDIGFTARLPQEIIGRYRIGNKMQMRQVHEDHKNQFRSILIIYILIASSLIIVVPLSIPKVAAPPIINHLASTADEDGVLPYDMDGQKNLIVVWDQTVDHWITNNYTVNVDYTLNIPPLNYMGDPGSGEEITFKTDNIKIDVFGTLITNSHSNPFSRTLFWGEDIVTWKGIHFEPGSEGNITECIIKGADKGIIFDNNGVDFSTLLAPGITRSTFTDMGRYGVQLFGPLGHKNIEEVTFHETLNTATGLYVTGVDIDIINVNFISHSNKTPSLIIDRANAYISQSSFYGDNIPGNLVRIFEGSSGTILDRCRFEDGPPDYPYIRMQGASPFIDNCSFDTSLGQLSVSAEDRFGIPSLPIIRNPTALTPGFWGDSFDNSSMNATGNSNITLQWYMNVNVVDPNSNLIENAPVWIVDRNGNSSEPPSKITDIDGWTRWFVVTELIQYNNSVDYFNSFNVSALNNSMMGYAVPEAFMNMSKEVTVIVPINPIPNSLPFVSWLSTPSDLQSGPVTIEYILEDSDSGDDGNLSVQVYYSVDGIGWKNATLKAGGDPTNKLKINTLYSFVWDSSSDLPDIYNETVFMMIMPYDRVGPGTSNQTGNFTLDNIKPKILSGPFVDVTNTTAIINWTVHEPANASLWWGNWINGSVWDLTTETFGSTGSTSQSVTINNLQSGRMYTFVINSTDPGGNTGSSYPLNNPYTFETSILIQLYAGWNMISLAPNILLSDVEFQLISISGQYEAVQIYDSTDSDDPWKHYVPGKLMGNDLTELHPDSGIWIKMKNDAVLRVNHMVPPNGQPDYEIGLAYGWNFVGYPSVVTRSVDVALAGVVYDMVQTYDAGSGKWYSYDGNSGDLTVMELGRGYWIHCMAPAGDVWSVSYI
jgi:hypothetical protein